MYPEVSFPNLGINIDKLPRVAFSVFGIDLYYYGIIIGLAFLAGTYYTIHEAKRTGQNPEIYSDFLLYAIILCVIGARIYYVIFSWDSYKDNLLKIFAIREGGLAVYGGIIAGVITAIVYTRLKGLSFKVFADTATPALILGQAIGRWGNFFNKEVFGEYTDSLFAMRYLKESVDSIPPKVLDKLVIVNGVEYIQVHPTFLYESVWCFAAFAFMNIYKRYKKFDGEICCLYFIAYGIGRFIIEGMRTDQLYIWNTNIAVSQILSLVLAITAIVYDIYIRRNQNNSAL